MPRGACTSSCVRFHTATAKHMEQSSGRAPRRPVCTFSSAHMWCSKQPCITVQPHTCAATELADVATRTAATAPKMVEVEMAMLSCKREGRAGVDGLKWLKSRRRPAIYACRTLLRSTGVRSTCSDRALMLARGMFEQWNHSTRRIRA